MGKWLLLLLLLAAPFIYGGFLLFERYQSNPETLIPWSYHLETYPELNSNAPIILIGDRLADRFTHYLPALSEKLSAHLENKIQIQSFAKKSAPLHRSLAEIKQLKTFPKILIYFGGSEEFVEEKFNIKDYSTIIKNLNIYEEPKFQTLMMIYPPLSRFLYHPIQQIPLKKETIREFSNKMNDDERLLANELFFKFYELELMELISLAKENNSVLFIITPPINLNVTPQNTCDQDKKLNEEAASALLTIANTIKNDDLKSAYTQGLDLVQKFPAHAGALFTMGQILKKMNRLEEAQKYLTLAAAYDCNLWRASPVTRAIQLKLAQKHNVYVFDFHQMLFQESFENQTFIDDIYPQDFYYSKLVDVFAIKLKKILRL